MKSVIVLNNGITMSFENLIIIASLVNVKVNYNYIVTDYSILKHTEGNRGGIEKKRVAYYVKLIKTGKFNFDLNVISVDIHGFIVEGHHRFEALKQLDYPVLIKIVKPQSLADISNFNSGLSSKWKAEQTFASALSEKNGANIKTLTLIDELRNDMLKKFNLPSSKLSTCELFGIAMKNTKHFGSGLHAPTVSMWQGHEIAFAVAKKDFKKLLNSYARLKDLLRSNRDAYKIAKVVMNLHFSDTDFNVDIFNINLSFEGFILNEYNVETITKKALSMYNKQMKLNNVA